MLLCILISSSGYCGLAFVLLPSFFFPLNFYGFCFFCRLAYLHEGLEPKVVHRDVKSSNILLDKKWNPKVSDFGLAKLLGSEASYVTTRVMGTFGFVLCHSPMSIILADGTNIYTCTIGSYHVIFVNSLQLCFPGICKHRNA